MIREDVHRNCKAENVRGLDENKDENLRYGHDLSPNRSCNEFSSVGE